MKKHTTEKITLPPVTLADNIESLGRGISVTYAGPTNFKGARWIAKICDGGRVTRATVPFNYGPGDDKGQTAAAVCLKKYISSLSTPGGETHKAEIYSSATVNGIFYVYFFRFLPRNI
jgi:hypothetical protein